MPAVAETGWRIGRNEAEPFAGAFVLARRLSDSFKHWEDVFRTSDRELLRGVRGFGQKNLELLRRYQQALAAHKEGLNARPIQTHVVEIMSRKDEEDKSYLKRRPICIDGIPVVFIDEGVNCLMHGLLRGESLEPKALGKENVRPVDIRRSIAFLNLYFGLQLIEGFPASQDIFQLVIPPETQIRESPIFQLKFQ